MQKTGETRQFIPVGHRTAHALQHLSESPADFSGSRQEYTRDVVSVSMVDGWQIVMANPSVLFCNERQAKGARGYINLGMDIIGYVDSLGQKPFGVVSTTSETIPLVVGGTEAIWA